MFNLLNDDEQIVHQMLFDSDVDDNEVISEEVDAVIADFHEEIISDDEEFHTVMKDKFGHDVLVSKEATASDCHECEN